MCKNLVILVSLTLMLIFSGNAVAVLTDTAWDNDDMDQSWSNGNNWQYNAVPGAAWRATIGLTGSNGAIISSDVGQVGQVVIGTRSDGEVDMTGGAIEVVGDSDDGGDFVVGQDAKGTFNLSNGSMTMERLQIGMDDGSAGSKMTMIGGSINSSNQTRIGSGHDNAEGTLDMQAGTITTDNAIKVGSESGTGTLLMSGGIIDASGQWCEIADNGGDGTFNISGGQFLARRLGVGMDGGGTASATISGTADIDLQQHMYIGRSGTAGSVIMSGGSISIGSPGDPRELRMAGNSSSVASLEMTGGEISMTGDMEVGTDGGDATVELHGGIISALNLTMGDLGKAVLDLSNAQAAGSGYGSYVLDAALILEGDKTVELQTLLLNGQITEDGGTLTDYVLEYNCTATGSVVEGTVLMAVPEPATIALLSIGAFAVFRRKRC